MMQKFDYSKVRLRARAPVGVEIFLIDGSMNRIAEGVETLDLEVTPGVYKVRFRVSNTTEDKFLVVTGDQPEVSMDAPELQYRTAIPFNDETSSAQRAAEASQSSSKAFGQGGAGLFLYLDCARPHSVTIATAEGNSITKTLGLNGRRTCNLELDPATYRVRVEHPVVGNFEMFVTTVEGWQTQVFLRDAEFIVGSETFRCPSLNKAGILMSPMGVGFQPDSKIARLTDIALHALVQKRPQVAETIVRRLLNEKLQDPLLGVFGLHLLLMQTRRDQRLMDTVCWNLQQMMPEHPDVKILSMRVQSEGERLVESVLYPPMLRASWELLVNATKRRASLVPPKSLTAMVAQNSIAGHPWLLHEFDEAREKTEIKDVTLAEAKRVAESFLEMNTRDLQDRVAQARESGETFSGLEENVLHNVLFEPLIFESEDEEKQKQLQRFRESIGVGIPTVNQMFSQIDAPSYAIAESVQSIAQKLKLYI